VESGYKEVLGSTEQDRTGVEFRDASLPEYGLGTRGTELSWQLQNNGKKGIRL
jgi:hypothetical protein